MRKTDQEVQRLMKEYAKHGEVGRAACGASMDRKTARKYIDAQKLPSELRADRDWRTRPDPFEADWPMIKQMLKDLAGLEAKIVMEHLIAEHADRYQESHLRPVLKAGRGRRLKAVIATLAPRLRGWIAYYQLASVTVDLQRLDAWLRRKLRCIVWRQWKNPRTRFNKLRQYGAYRERAARAAWNGRGPWWNAGASHMNLVIPNGMLRQLGLISLLDERQRFVNLA